MKINRNILIPIVCIIVILGIGLISVIKNKNDNKLETEPSYVQINVKDYGSIVVRVDPTYAPITVTHFLKLVDKGFYDGLTFHRIIENFMIQGGGYDIEGNRKIADTIKGEFSKNGVENNLSHKRGVISMARNSVDYDSASAQFFITHVDRLDLDGNYAAFGEVVAGMEVVDEIVNKANPTDDNGTIDIEDRPVIESIKRIKGSFAYENNS